MCSSDPSAAGPDRRCLLAAAAAGAVVALTGCSTYGGDQEAAPAPAAPAPAVPSGASAGGAGLVALADVPVGGGKVLADAKLVITQPTAGTVKAFSAVCTHQGCTVADVANGTINCPCHGSRFRIADGSVAGGPAPRPLPPVTVSVRDGQVVKG
jgi:Rieske Fe-S protein